MLFTRVRILELYVLVRVLYAYFMADVGDSRAEAPIAGRSSFFLSFFC